ncbi:MAG: peptidylprolyl isomerase [Ruminococcus sp.]|nr:peptidylprolyl isomerase [Ruminococcus sp.]
MFKKVLAGIFCIALAASALSSCGQDTKNTQASDNNKVTTAASEDETTVATVPTTVENVDIANFTAPEKGDTIVVMKVKDYGTVKFRLFPEYAEKGVENFVELAKKGYYDGLKFHRVITDFMVQGGDPQGIGIGGESIWGGKFDGGTDLHLIHASGALAYANSGSTATNGSQFYVVTGTKYTKEELDELAKSGYAFSENARKIYEEVGGAPWLDGSYTVFGQVIDGLDVIFKIQNVSVDSNSMPYKDLIMESVTVGEYDGEDIRWYISDYDEFDADEIRNSTGKENLTIANFTAPKEGEKVVSLKVKGYDKEIKIKLFPEYAEKGVENFITLAERGYYDGLTFHRVIKDFMIQGGDPNGDGTGGECIFEKGFDDNDTDPHLIHASGAVAYANSGSTASNGSQFYIVTGEVYEKDQINQLKDSGYAFTDNEAEVYSTYGGAPWLDGSYTIFGQVYDGLDVVFKIQETETGNNDKPAEDVIIEKVTVSDFSGGDVHWNIKDYS